jgi:hypothetical protein
VVSVIVTVFTLLPISHEEGTVPVKVVVFESKVVTAPTGKAARAIPKEEIKNLKKPLSMA